MERINVTQASLPTLEEYMAEVGDLFDSHWITNYGSKAQHLQKKLTAYLGVENFFLFVNGHTALELALQALELEGEVITTPFTFASTTHAIVRNGLTPVFCDIRQEDFTLDVDKIEALITEKTCAILPVHVYGNLCQVEAIAALAKKYHLKGIYDAAHAFGEAYQGQPVGNFGDISMFSFHATKVFNTIEGGGLSFQDASLEKKFYGLTNFGIYGEDIVELVGANGKMNEFQAAMGLCNLRKVGADIRKRKALSELYDAYLADIPGIRVNQAQAGVKRNYSYYPILIDEKICGSDRDQVIAALQAENIYPRKYFYPLTSEFACYQKDYDAKKATPVAYEISQRVLTLPLYPSLTQEQVEKIVTTLIHAVQGEPPQYQWAVG